MSGTAIPRPYGRGPYGTGPYGRSGHNFWDVGCASGIAFDVTTTAALTYSVMPVSEIAWNVVSRGITQIMHVDALTEIAWDVQAEFWQSWAMPAPCFPGVWQTFRVGPPPANRMQL